MLSHGFAIIRVMHIATLTYGRNCESAQQIERPTDVVHINGPHSPLAGPQGSQVNHIQEPPKPRNRCCPYDFNSNLCQVVNDRLLCGYNRNVGRPASYDRAFGLSGGCRLRGGRLECGYEQGPFNGIRRPPGWDEAPHNVEDENKVEKESNSVVVNNVPSPGNNTLVIINKSPINLNSDEYEKSLLKLDLKNAATTKKYLSMRATRCVEIHERVVCKPTT